MPTTLKPTPYVWTDFVLSLVLNVVMMLVAKLVRLDIITKNIVPFIFVVFIMQSMLSFNGYSLSLMILLIFINLFNYMNSKQGENGDDEEGKDQQSSSSDGLPKLGNFQFETVLFVLISCLYQLANGIDHYHAWNNQNYEYTINYIFYNLFLNITLQYCYGMYVMMFDPPTWLYYVYMIPHAIFYPLGSVISFYVNHSVDDYINDISEYMSAINMFLGFKMMYQHLKSNQNTMTENIIQSVILAVGFLWMVFVDGIYTMGNYPYSSDV